MAQNITFPVVELIPGTKIRRNAETGVEIVKARDGYAVILDHKVLATRPRLAEARTEAAKHAQAVITDRAAAAAESPEVMSEGERRGRRLYPTAFAILDEAERTEAAVAAATAPALERVELIEFGTAEPSGYVYMLSARPGHAVCLPSMPKLEIVKRGREWVVAIAGQRLAARRTKRDARARLDEWLVEHLRKINA